ncbi:MAG: cytochrome c oxidase subunit II [Alcanivoracaceae bacterium]|jgi:cytochrome c oxidase subunit 2|nr:cytochrome c oxidase subunit II [Alcanivoracaceae bacterium]
MQSTLFRRVTAALTLLLVSGVSVASDWAERSNVNLRPGVTNISQDVFDLHMVILWIVSLIGLLVFGLIMYSAVAHRRSKRPQAADFHENVFLEVFWTVLPFIILIGMAVPATRVLIAMDDSSDAELTVKVTGYRWNWSYEYLSYQDDNDVGIFYFSNLKTPAEQYNRPILKDGLFPYGTAADRVGVEPVEKDANYMLAVDKPLVIPAGVKVRFLVTADDVIHSFFMPDFAIKKDAIPGFVNEAWTLVPEDATGTYYGQCAELCGKNHAFMPIEVRVLAQNEFDSWIAEEKEKAASGPDLTPFSSLESAMELGQQKYAAACVLCHGAEGQGGIGLPFAGSALMTDSSRVQENIDVLIKGRNAMPSFAAQLTPREIAAVITYQRNAFGNNTGDLVQPADVAK